jgi:hypothetical protein
MKKATIILTLLTVALVAARLGLPLGFVDGHLPS